MGAASGSLVRKRGREGGREGGGFEFNEEIFAFLRVTD